MDLYERANMVVLAAPCPPLPMLGIRDGEHCTDTVFLSHDLLRATFINVMTCGTDEDKSRHIEESKKADDELVERIKRADESDYYDIFCQYMRRLLQVHAAVGSDIRFKPMGYVSVGDAVHKGACSHLRGQDYMYELASGPYDKMCYTDLVKIYASRLGV